MGSESGGSDKGGNDKDYGGAKDPSKGAGVGGGGKGGATANYGGGGGKGYTTGPSISDAKPIKGPTVSPTLSNVGGIKPAVSKPGIPAAEAALLAQKKGLLDSGGVDTSGVKGEGLMGPYQSPYSLDDNTASTGGVPSWWGQPITPSLTPWVFGDVGDGPDAEGNSSNIPLLPGYEWGPDGKTQIPIQGNVFDQKSWSDFFSDLPNWYSSASRWGAGGGGSPGWAGFGGGNNGFGGGMAFGANNDISELIKRLLAQQFGQNP